MKFLRGGNKKKKGESSKQNVSSTNDPPPLQPTKQQDKEEEKEEKEKERDPSLTVINGNNGAGASINNSDSNDDGGGDGDHDDDDNDDDDDPDAHLKDIRNLKRPAVTGGSTDPRDLRGLMDRYDEKTSYTNRSERSHKKPDCLPSKKEMAARTTKFKDDVTVYADGDGMTEDEMKLLYMQEEDFKRCDVDVELTLFRWEKHQKGKMTFNEEENTLRGLEDVIFYNPKKYAARAKHVQDILTEVAKQKAKHGVGVELDYNKIRAVAEKTSIPAAEQAAAIGENDAKHAKVILSGLEKRFYTSRGGNSKTKSVSTRQKSVGRMRMMLSFKQNKK